MKQESHFHQTVLDQLYDGVYFVDRQRRITYWNRGAVQLTGYTPEEVVGSSCGDGVLMHVDGDGKNLCEEGCPLAATLEDGQVREMVVFLHHKDGHRLPVAVRAAPITDGSGMVVGAVEIFKDNSGSVDLSDRLARLEKQALLDPLTGIGNRRYLTRHLEARVEEYRRYNVTFGVLFIDIDHFKRVNDNFGHLVGDRVLRMVAQTVAVNLRPFDEAGRWGGEEFVSVVANVDGNDLSIVAERLRMLVEASSLGTEKGAVRVTVSIGAVLAAADEDAESVLERADQVMYQSKLAGRNQVTLGY
jgi:diguanylate cyclase (GGDEF)-like protein/PAS domain S-box-containing protein